MSLTTVIRHSLGPCHEGAALVYRLVLRLNSTRTRSIQGQHEYKLGLVPQCQEGQCNEEDESTKSDGS